MPLYTPFFEKGMQKLGEGYGTMRRNQFVQDAYMGDKDALGNLYRVDPDTALAIEERQKQEALQQEQTRIAKQQAQTEAAADLRAENRDIGQYNMDVGRYQQEMAQWPQEIQQALATAVEPILKTASNFSDLEEFRAHAKRVSGGDPLINEMADDMTQEAFEGFRTAYPFTDGTNKDREIDALTALLAPTEPNPREIAEKIAYGMYEIEFPEGGSGTAILKDNIKMITDPDNALTYLDINQMGEDAAIPEPQAGQTLYELAGTAGGLEGATKEMAAILAGQFGADVYSETVEARQTFNTTISDMIRGLSVNQKFPIGEMNFLRDEIKITPSITTPGPVSQARMRSLDRSLSTRLEMMERDMADTSLPAAIRSSQRSNAANIRNFLSVMGVPEQMVVMADQVTIDSLEFATSRDAREIQRGISEEEYRKLFNNNPEALEFLQKRSRGETRPPEEEPMAEPVDLTPEDRSKNFVQRYLKPDDYPTIDNGDGTESTHKMADSEVDGRFFAYPTIIQKADGSLEELSDAEALQYALRTGEFMEFPTQEEATAYSTNGYKSKWGAGNR